MGRGCGGGGGGIDALSLELGRRPLTLDRRRLRSVFRPRSRSLSRSRLLDRRRLGERDLDLDLDFDLDFDLDRECGRALSVSTAAVSGFFRAFFGLTQRPPASRISPSVEMVVVRVSG